MTTYTAIPNGDIDQDSPITQTLMTLLRDNPLAIQEGDATAPEIQEAALVVAVGTTGVDWVKRRVAGVAAGDVGAYAFLTQAANTTTEIAASGTYAGSGLRFSGYLANGNTFTVHEGTSGSIVSGTWRAMGSGSDGISVNGQRTTLFLRIS